MRFWVFPIVHLIHSKSWLCLIDWNYGDWSQKKQCADFNMACNEILSKFKQKHLIPKWSIIWRYTIHPQSALLISRSKIISTWFATVSLRAAASDREHICILSEIPTPSAMTSNQKCGWAASPYATGARLLCWAGTPRASSPSVPSTLSPSQHRQGKAH
jgi:hypothetical protein